MGKTYFMMRGSIALLDRVSGLEMVFGDYFPSPARGGLSK